MTLTLGSLFDGSGGFPLAAQQLGITPVWASEIEPFPIKVTRKHFPHMKHLGDVRNIRGDKIEPVDIITFGSSCQSFSIAGNREGLDGVSGIFFEAVRVIREMLEATDGQYPRVALMENVPGMLSSKGGDDFAEVLRELTSLSKEELHVTRSERWTQAGSIVADRFGLAWRILNSQFFGSPQSRRRVFLVVCPRSQGGGVQAQSILGEPEDVSGYPPKSQGAEQGNTSSADGGSAQDVSMIPVEYQPTDSRIKLREDGTVQTLCSRMGTGGNTVPLILDTDEMILRKLTPSECARLQGFPGDYCEGLEDDSPTGEDLAFWQDVWDAWMDLQGKKHKTENQIRKWLASTPTDAAQYKMWGNGISLPVVSFILSRIKEALDGTKCTST